jgi:hypothetical protein
MRYFAIGLVATSLALPALAEVPLPKVVAQPATAVSQPVAVLEPVAPQSILRASTEVPLITREELTTKKKLLRVGQRIQMEVASNVESNGVVVIPAGTPAVGELTEVRNKGMWGKSGYISARVLSLRLGDRQIRLSGTFDDKGVTGTAGVVGAVAFIPVAGFFATGTSAAIPTGSAVKAFLEEDIVFRTVAVQPQVIEVPVATPAPVAAPAPAVASTPAQGAAAQTASPPVATPATK